MEIGNDLILDIGPYQVQLEKRLAKLKQQNFAHRLWNEKESIWNKAKHKIDSAELPMGWLNVVDQMLVNLPGVEEFCNDVKIAGFESAVLLGMGGSSLAPLVFQKSFQDKVNGLKLTVLDSTDPDTIWAIEEKINISKTLFIVSSKSGSTAEVLALYNYFYDKLSQVQGERTGKNFIAITDEGSPLIDLARRKGFRKTFINFADIGGRYSALSYFGIVPAALMGINVKELLVRALSMVHSCGPTMPLAKNPGICLGVAIAEMAARNCDKLIYFLPEHLSSFGLWLEQLLAESTGKMGKGILPIKGDAASSGSYSADAFFMQLGFTGKEQVQFQRQKDFRSAKFPLISILLTDELDLGKEFFKWEIATATAGALLGVNPFDQPNVQESKKCTDELVNEIKQSGKFLGPRPTVKEDTLQFFSFEKAGSVEELVGSILRTIKPGDYLAIQAFLAENDDVQKKLGNIRSYFQKTFNIVTTAEFGPRYLHSTGQYHKGGPAKGIFIQFISDPTRDINIPKQNYSFGQLKRAQAIGDMKALLKRKRRVVLVDLGTDCYKGLIAFSRLLETMLSGAKPLDEKGTVKDHESFTEEQKDRSGQINAIS